MEDFEGDEVVIERKDPVVADGQLDEQAGFGSFAGVGELFGERQDLPVPVTFSSAALLPGVDVAEPVG